MSDDFEVIIASPPEFEDLVAEINFKDEFVALISRERGIDSLDVEIHSRPNGQPWKFNLSDFEKALERGKARLTELRGKLDNS